MKKDQELAGIECLRFVCALSVLVWHYQHFFFRGEWDPHLSVALRTNLPLYSEFSEFYQDGSLAVQFFWAISGFIFYRNYLDPIRNETVNFYEFLVRRFSRLYPLHFITLLIVTLGQWAYYESHGETFIYSWNKPIWFAAQLLFASNWFTREPLTFNGPIWSVSIEIVVYILFFAVAHYFRKGTLIASLIVAISALCFNYLHSFLSAQVFECAMYFFAGGIACWLSTLGAALRVSACSFIAIVLSLTVGGQNLNFIYLLLLAMSVVIVMAKIGETFLRMPFRHLAFLGNATYASYLLHFPLQLLIVSVVDAIGLQRDIFYNPIWFMGYLGGVVALSLIVHKYYEMPAQSFLRRRANSKIIRKSVVAAEIRRA